MYLSDFVSRRSGTVTPPTAADPGGDWESLSGHRLVKVIEATGTCEASYERCFDGIWRGQFTWAAMAILRNWPVVRLETSVPYVALTAELLAKKIAVLLRCSTTPLGCRSRPAKIGRASCRERV